MHRLGPVPPLTGHGRRRLAPRPPVRPIPQLTATGHRRIHRELQRHRLARRIRLRSRSAKPPEPPAPSTRRWTRPRRRPPCTRARPWDAPSSSPFRPTRHGRRRLMPRPPVRAIPQLTATGHRRIHRELQRRRLARHIRLRTAQRNLRHHRRHRHDVGLAPAEDHLVVALAPGCTVFVPVPPDTTRSSTPCATTRRPCDTTADPRPSSPDPPRTPTSPPRPAHTTPDRSA